MTASGRIRKSTVEVESPSIEKWAQKVAAANGFSDVDHVVEISGLCAPCQAELAAAAN